MLAKNKLHIIAFDVPYPPDYGGVIDIYYKIKHLAENNISVYLHVFQYGRPQAVELEYWCEKVYYYKRKTYKNPFYSKLPYIISTRSSEELLENLHSINAPILFEGLHCTLLINHPNLEKRLKMVRCHNIEHEYYHNLELVEGNYFKKYFFRLESERLKAYEKQLKHADALLAISEKDQKYYQKRFPGISHYIPAFHANEKVEIKTGRGEFIYYHGNLGVGENNHAALYLAQEILPYISYPTIIAGNNPSDELEKAVEKLEHVRLEKDLTNKKIIDYIGKAQINLLPTFQATGIKLKLINALFKGRHCIVNTPMVEDNNLASLCHVADTPSEIIQQINKLWNTEFTSQEVSNRKNILEQEYSPKATALKIIQLLQELG